LPRLPGRVVPPSHWNQPQRSCCRGEHPKARNPKSTVIQNQVEGISYFSPSSPSPSTMTTFCRGAGAARGSRTLREGLPMSKHDEVLTASAVNRANARQVTRDPTEGMPHVQPWSDRGICNVTTPLTPPTASPLHRVDTSPPPLRVPSNPNSMSVTTTDVNLSPSAPPLFTTGGGHAARDCESCGREWARRAGTGSHGRDSVPLRPVFLRPTSGPREVQYKAP
jgi:hypothetical protein